MSVDTYSLEELSKHYEHTQSEVSKYVRESDYLVLENQAKILIEAAEDNAAQQRHMKTIARKQRDECRNLNKQLEVEKEALSSLTYDLAHHIMRIFNTYNENTGNEPSLSVFHRALHEAYDATKIWQGDVQ